MYALVIDNIIQSTGSLPRSARRLDTGEWVLGLRDASPDFHIACGYFPITDNHEPLDANEHHGAPTYTFDANAGVVTATYPAEPDTLETQNQRIIEQRAAAHLAALRLIRSSTGNLSAANLSNAVRALADATIDLGRYVHNRFEDTT